MKSILRVTLSVSCLFVIATLMECGGSSPKITLLTITTATLPNATAGTEYNQTIQANGGVGPFNWLLGSGTLPPNLQLIPSSTNTATITGMPDTPIQGDTFTVKVIDAANQSATQAYKVSIMGLLDTLTLSPANLTFNPQLAATTSATQTATLTNLGSTSIAINNVVATGNNPGDFSQTNTCGLAVAPSSSCEISVTFTPVQPGPRVASISINDDTNDTPHQVGLNGTGLTTGPNATLSAASLTFVSQGVGTTSPPQTLTLTNYGEAMLNITSIAATANFAESSTCGPSLAPSANCPISVTFSPSSSGNATGTLSVDSNASGSPQTTSLSGAGSTGHPVLTGECSGFVQDGAPNECSVALDLGDCAPGETAIQPQQWGSGCYPNPVNYIVDASKGCSATSRIGTVSGYCVAQTPAASARARVSLK